jgi:hypothetical protein
MTKIKTYLNNWKIRVLKLFRPALARHDWNKLTPL